MVERNRDKRVASAQRRQQRGRQNELVYVLDGILPASARRDAAWNCAGGRSLGTCGRSLHNVLEDTIEYLHAWHAGKAAWRAAAVGSPLPLHHDTTDDTTDAQSPPECSPVDFPASRGLGLPSMLYGSKSTAVEQGSAAGRTLPFRDGIMSSHMLAAIEVSIPGWTVEKINPAARALFGEMPFMEMPGQSMLNGFVHADDMEALKAMWDQAVKGGVGVASKTSTARSNNGTGGGGIPAAQAGTDGPCGGLLVRMLTCRPDRWDKLTCRSDDSGEGQMRGGQERDGEYHVSRVWTSHYRVVRVQVVMIRQNRRGWNSKSSTGLL